jgi:hypothetical protein
MAWSQSLGRRLRDPENLQLVVVIVFRFLFNTIAFASLALHGAAFDAVWWIQLSLVPALSVVERIFSQTRTQISTRDVLK